MKTFQRILAMSPHDAYALENIGTVHLQQGDLAAARDAFTKALAADPRSSRAHAGMGVVKLQTGDRDGAIAEWKQAIATDPRNFDALFNLADELIRAGRLDEARPYVQRFADTAPRATVRPGYRQIEGCRSIGQRPASGGQLPVGSSQFANVELGSASEHRERATRPERAGEAAREGACRGVRGAKPLG